MKKFLCRILVILLLVPLSVTAVPQQNGENVLVSGLNKFALNFYRPLSKGGENVISSPYSLSSLLALLTIGAAGDTRQQFLQVLNIGPIADVKTISTDLNTINLSLNTTPLCTGKIACTWNKIKNVATGTAPGFLIVNAFWAADDLNYKQSFLDIIQKDKPTLFYRIDFHAAEKATQTMNQWVAEKTSNYIPELFAKGLISSETKLILINTVFFKGKWQFPFKVQNTQEKPFLVTQDNPVQVKMMQQQDDFFYTENEHLQMLKLPYMDSSLAMIVLLPKAKHTLPEIAQNLTLDNLLSLLQSAHEQKVNVSLPKFKISSTFNNLGQQLKDMGLTAAFDITKANFSDMVTGPFAISGAIQKAIIEVDEEGTVAAAATATIMEGSAWQPPVSFNADHPFLFVIMDTKSKLILFMGQVTNPK